MSRNKVRWGILSTANIGMGKVTPGIQKSAHSEVVAIASRDLGWALPRLMAPMKSFSPILISTPSTIPCPTTCTCR